MNLGPQERNLSLLGVMIYSFTPHVFGSGLWASTCADMCHVTTHCGFTHEEVACVENGGLDSAEN